MNSASITALAAILGSCAGAFSTIATTWLSQRWQRRGELIRTTVREREELYARFVEECSKLAIEALDHHLDHPEKLFGVYALLNRMRILSSDAVVAAAERAIAIIVAQYFKPNISPEDIRALALSRTEDPLGEFGQACRVEIQSLQRAA
jgi:hypothetical protein